jgi:hypothetical protein
MASRNRVIIVAVGLALAACQEKPAAQTAAAGCNGAVCNVVIKIDNCDPVPTPDPVPVPGTGNVVINWRIDPQSAQAGFTFTPTNGIVPHDDQDNQFSGNTAESPTHFHVNDKNSNATKYKYAINVQKNGAACPTKDPFIQNRS